MVTTMIIISSVLFGDWPKSEDVAVSPLDSEVNVRSDQYPTKEEIAKETPYTMDVESLPTHSAGYQEQSDDAEEKDVPRDSASIVDKPRSNENGEVNFDYGFLPSSKKLWLEAGILMLVALMWVGTPFLLCIRYSDTDEMKAAVWFGICLGNLLTLVVSCAVLVLLLYIE